MTYRIALVQKGECAVYGALAGLRDIAPIELRQVAVAHPAQMREAMTACDAAFTLFDSEDDFSQALQAQHDGLPPLVVDFSPVLPAVFARTHESLARAGVELAGVQSAAGGTLRLYADTALQSREDLLAVLRRAAHSIHFTGAAGTSKAMATIERLLFAASSAASAEAIALATHAGLDARATRELLAKGSGANEVLASGVHCTGAAAVQAIERGQDLARPHQYPLPLCVAAKVFHQSQGACA